MLGSGRIYIGSEEVQVTHCYSQNIVNAAVRTSHLALVHGFSNFYSLVLLMKSKESLGPHAKEVVKYTTYLYIFHTEKYIVQLAYTG
jgi:hypothetical protein